MSLRSYKSSLAPKTLPILSLGPEEKMEEFVAYLVKNMVDEPDLVDIRSHEEGDNLAIEIRVAPKDIGKVVGKKGNAIRSLRTLTMIIGARLKKRVSLEIFQEHPPQESKE